MERKQVLSLKLNHVENENGTWCISHVGLTTHEKITWTDEKGGHGKRIDAKKIIPFQTPDRSTITDVAGAWIDRTSYRCTYTALDTIYRKSGWVEYLFACQSLIEKAKMQGYETTFALEKKEHNYAMVTDAKGKRYRKEVIPTVEVSYHQTQDEKDAEKRAMLQGHQIAEACLMECQLAMTEAIAHGIGDVNQTDDVFRYSINRVNRKVYSEKKGTANIEPLENTLEDGTTVIREDVERAKNCMQDRYSLIMDDLLHMIEISSNKRSNHELTKQVFMLSVHGVPQEIIADICKVSQKTVSLHWQRAKELTMRYFKEK